VVRHYQKQKGRWARCEGLWLYIQQASGARGTWCLLLMNMVPERSIAVYTTSRPGARQE